MPIPRNHIAPLNQKIKSIAGFWAKKTPEHIRLEDLIQIGWEVAIVLSNKHHPDTLAFSKMIVMRIKGAIIDYLRANDYMPRHSRTKLKDIVEAERRVSQKVGRTPNDREISIEAGITIEEYFWVTGNVSVGSLSKSDFIGDDYCHHWAHEEKAEPELSSAELNKIIDKLKASHKDLIRLKYYGQLRNVEVSKIMGITPGRVTQLHDNAIQNLREILREDIGWDMVIQ